MNKQILPSILVLLLLSISIANASTCISRPACLDATPRCLIAEPADGWCPQTISVSGISVNAPTTFSLKINGSATVANYQNMKIKLQKINSLTIQTYPEQIRKNVEISVTSPGGCGPNADPRCLGMPAFENSYTIGERGSVTALALKISVNSISDDNVIFAISMPDVGTPPPNPAPTPIGVPGTIEGKEAIIVCPNGMTGNNCSICSEGGCSTPGTPPENRKDKPGIVDGVPPRDLPGSIEGNPPTLSLPKGRDVVSVEKVETGEGAPAHYEVRTKKKARILFIFPVSSKITYSVNPETGASAVVSRPWWNFLAW